MIRRAALLAAVSLSLAACHDQAAGGGGGTRAQIRAVGSSTVYPFTAIAAEQFLANTPGARPPVGLLGDFLHIYPVCLLAGFLAATINGLERSRAEAAYRAQEAERTALEAQARLVGTGGVADVNFRTTADSFGTVYLLGRARSKEEAKKALSRARDGDGVKKVVSYVETRP